MNKALILFASVSLAIGGVCITSASDQEWNDAMVPVAKNYDGCSTVLTVSNKSAEDATIGLHFYTTDGEWFCWELSLDVIDSLAPHSTNVYDMASFEELPDGSCGYLHISSRQDFEVKVNKECPCPTVILNCVVKNFEECSTVFTITYTGEYPWARVCIEFMNAAWDGVLFLGDMMGIGDISQINMAEVGVPDGWYGRALIGSTGTFDVTVENECPCPLVTPTPTSTPTPTNTPTPTATPTNTPTPTSTATPTPTATPCRLYLPIIMKNYVA
jgi:hypothetical protein